MPPVHRPQAKFWCFTLNNPEANACAAIADSEDLQYLVYQRERGENGTEHFQGYAQFKRVLRLTQVRQLIARAHWEVSRGTPVQARDYCMKEDTRIGEVFEVGTFLERGAGRRSDLAEVQSALDNGLKQHEYATEFFSTFVRYPRLLSTYRAAKIKPRTPSEETVCWLLIGGAGFGKSRYSDAIARLWSAQYGGRSDSVYRHDLGKWFDGYGGERVVIFDDFRGSSCPFTTFKRVVDRYPLQLEVKGTSCNMGATRFLINTNIPPESWWKEEVTGPELSAIYRRINRVLFFDSESQFIPYDTWPECARVHFAPHAVQATLEHPPPEIIDWEALETTIQALEAPAHEELPLQAQAQHPLQQIEDI